MTTGFDGGGMQGGTTGTAVDANDNAWFANYGSKSITVFDKNGKPLTPPDGVTLNGQLGLMQGIIATPSGDVWAVGISKNQLVFFPNGDPTKGRPRLPHREAQPNRLIEKFQMFLARSKSLWQC